MSLYAFITGLTSLTFFLTGLYVYVQNVHRLLYKRCFIFSASVALWSLGYFTTLLEAPSYQVNIIASRLSHAFGAFIPITYLHFVWAILRRHPRKKLFFWSYLFSAFMFLMCLTSLVVKELLPKMGIKYYPEWGILYPVYSALFLAFPGYAQYEMGIEIMRTRGTNRTRLIYFFVALALAFSGGISLFLLIFNLQFPPYLSVLIILYPPMMAYTILVYRFMDIEVIIRKTIVFAGLASFILGIFAIVTFIAKEILNHYIAVRSSFINVASVILIVVSYEPLRNFLISFTDHYLFQKKVNYRILLKEATEYLAHLDSLKWQARRIIAFLLLKARITNACIYSFHSFAPGSLLLQASRPKIKAEGHKVIVLSHPLVQYMKVHRSSVELRILEEAKASEKELEKIKALDQMISLFKEHRAEAAIPCFGSGAAERARHTELHLRGILFLGHQKSDEPYTEEDLDVFFTLGQESSIAFENARLYDEAVERAQELELINQQLNDAQTRMMRALKEAEEANQRLQATQAALIVAEKKATLVGMAQAMGHEIYNPLSPILGWSQSIYKRDVTTFRDIFGRYHNQMSSDDSAKLDKALSGLDEKSRIIANSAFRIEGVVRTLTGTLKQSTGEMGPLSLAVFFQRVFETARFTTGDENMPGCAVELDIEKNLMIFGNADQLEQVFLNLIKNAYEAMLKQQERQIHVKVRTDDVDPLMATIDFSDNGPGIPAEILPKIWVQGFTTKVKKGESIGASGQGQGLFVCKHIIETFHKGSITVQSTIGKGTTFTIKLHLFISQNSDKAHP